MFDGARTNCPVIHLIYPLTVYKKVNAYEQMKKTDFFLSSFQKYKDCKELLDVGYTESGMYWIFPDGVNKRRVYCEQKLEGGGWMVRSHLPLKIVLKRFCSSGYRMLS